MKPFDSEPSNKPPCSSDSKILEELRKISELSQYLRYSGPAPEDLQSLSDALEQAIDIADELILQIEIAQMKS
ncbi:MAG: hypothetical protein Q4F13_08930 [Pseudomonadota bacterium]|nr:hypothetical protein [Pseudomonadota bacterium]